MKTERSPVVASAPSLWSSGIARWVQSADDRDSRALLRPTAATGTTTTTDAVSGHAALPSSTSELERQLAQQLMIEKAQLARQRAVHAGTAEPPVGNVGAALGVAHGTLAGAGLGGLGRLRLYDQGLTPAVLSAANSPRSSDRRVPPTAATDSPFAGAHVHAFPAALAKQLRRGREGLAANPGHGATHNHRLARNGPGPGPGNGNGPVNGKGKGSAPNSARRYRRGTLDGGAAQARGRHFSAHDEVRNSYDDEYDDDEDDDENADMGGDDGLDDDDDDGSDDGFDDDGFDDERDGEEEDEEEEDEDEVDVYGAPFRTARRGRVRERDSQSDSDAAQAAMGGSTRSAATDPSSTDASAGRPHVTDIPLHDLASGSYLPEFATAADAEIGRQMYAQEAYTAQTISQEVQTQKADFGAFIDNLISLLKLRTDVLQSKLSIYKARFRNVQILVFIGSALIALITGFRVMYAAFQEDSQHAGLVAGADNATTAALAGFDLSALLPAEVLAFDLAIFGLSTAMGLLTTIATFRGWAKKADDMSTVYARSQMVVLALSDSQLQIKFIGSPEQMQLLRSTFFAREFKMYADLMRTMADHISFRTLTKHLPAQYDLNVQFLKDDTEYQAALLNIFVDNQTVLQEVANRHRAPPPIDV